eukprot:2007254-Alexandrium_andersonii.AAC.1
MRTPTPSPLLVGGLCRATGRTQRPTLFSTHGIQAGVRICGPARSACSSLRPIALERHRIIVRPVELV